MADASLFINRELSWVDFNRRVLEEAEDPLNPLLERCSFLGITASNLDEFYMVRIPGLKKKVDAGKKKEDEAGLTPKQQLKKTARAVHDLAADQLAVEMRLREELAEAGIRILFAGDADEAQTAFIRTWFMETAEPLMTPMRLEAKGDLPYLSAKTLYILMRLEKKDSGAPVLLLVRLPDMGRWVSLPGSEGDTVMPLEEAIGLRLGRLYDKEAYRLEGALLFRLTRDTDMPVDDTREDLMGEIRASIAKRATGRVVRLEWAEAFAGCEADAKLTDFLIDKLELKKKDLFPTGGLVDLKAYSQLADAVDRKDLEYEKQPPVMPAAIRQGESIFDVIARGDVLLHHPYESFEPVLMLLRTAAEDPATAAIKMTLYRVSKNSPVITALCDAAKAGKQVTVLVELKARFDEENNLGWADVLKNAGCRVLYGVPGLKVHCKALLVVRRENGGLRRYMHWGTGNYNDATAKHYTDMGLLTCNDTLGEDAEKLFEFLADPSRPMAPMTLLHAAPTGLRPLWNEHIEAEIRNAREGRPAHVWAKVNSLQDTDIIRRLYEASQAGVKVDLVVRGVCGVKAGIPGVSENIRVVSILGRHLEHHRIFRFLNGGRDSVYLASADWMVRNLDKRVETCFPILDEGIKARVIRVLEAALADNMKAREMREDGTFTRVEKAEDATAVNFQAWCYDCVSGAPAAEISAAPVTASVEKPVPEAPIPMDESVFRAPEWVPDVDEEDPLDSETPLPRPDKE